MGPIIIQTVVSSDGTIELTLPPGAPAAGTPVHVTIEVVREPAAEAWKQGILATAGKWSGPIERPAQGEYERRTALS